MFQAPWTRVYVKQVHPVVKVAKTIWWKVWKWKFFTKESWIWTWVRGKRMFVIDGQFGSGDHVMEFKVQTPYKTGRVGQIKNMLGCENVLVYEGPVYRGIPFNVSAAVMYVTCTLVCGGCGMCLSQRGGA